MARVLAFTPTYGDGPDPRCVASVVGLRWDGELVWEVGRENPYPPPDLRNVFAQYARARELALAGGFDALLTVEHDMVLPAHALERLWGADGDVVYGVYLFRHGSGVINAFALSGGPNIGSSLSLYPRQLARAERIGEVEVSGAGFGCTLIRRSVLERIPFRPDGEKAPDIPLAMDCLAAGIRQVARFDVRCGHVEGGTVLMVGEEPSGMQAVTVNQNVTVPLTGVGTVALRSGAVREIPACDVSDLVRAGYVSILIAEGEKQGASGLGGRGIEDDLTPALSKGEGEKQPAAKPKSKAKGK